MGEVATIEVERVFPGRKAGKSEVFDVRTADGKKFAAWGTIGETMHGIGSGSVTVEYELRPKNGYDNATILKIVGSGNGSTPTKSGKPALTAVERDAAIAWGLSLKIATHLVTAFGDADSPYDGLIQAAALAPDVLMHVTGEIKLADDQFSLADTD